MARRRKSLLGRLLTLLFVAAVVLAAACGVSVWRMRGLVQEAQVAYEDYEARLKDGDWDAALTSLHTAAQDVSVLRTETQSWPWQVARYVPVLGEDVVCGQQLADIADRLVGNTLIPVVTQAKAASEDLANVGALVGELSDARDTVASCREELNALPTPHVPELVGLVSDAREALAEADETFGQFDVLFSLADVIEGVAGLLQGE